MDKADTYDSASPAKMRRQRKMLYSARHSDFFLIRILPENTGLFRCLLESAGSHIAMVKVIDSKAVLFKLLFSPHQRNEIIFLLEGMKRTVPFDYEEWNFPSYTV